MSTYLIINIAIIIIPLILSFEKKITFYKKVKPLLFSILPVGVAFIVWDSVATARGDWFFSPLHTGTFKLFNLPLEEILFFITVPYAILFTYESLKYYFSEKHFNVNRNYLLLLALIAHISIYIFRHNDYTFTLSIFLFLFFIVAYFVHPTLLSSNIYWLTIIISFIPFVAVNYILTSLPVVSYAPAAITGYRFLTIPIEDFFYSFVMISSWILCYELYFKLFPLGAPLAVQAGRNN